MKRYFELLSLLAFTLFVAQILPAAGVEIGQPAPNFTLQGSDGKMHSLKDYPGKIVVLEWSNHDCPFVRKAYDSHNMQKLQSKYTAKGVIWLTIISSAKGKQGYETAAQENQILQAEGASPTAALLDPTGKVGHLYSAKTTPDMFVIDQNGNLVYMGAIDDKPSTDVADVKTARNYVSAALDEVMSGKPVTTAATTSYGCSVKY